MKIHYPTYAFLNSPLSSILFYFLPSCLPSCLPSFVLVFLPFFFLISFLLWFDSFFCFLLLFVSFVFHFVLSLLFSPIISFFHLSSSSPFLLLHFPFYILSGDALLTSLHVAKQVGICDTDRQTLTLIGKEEGEISSPSQSTPKMEGNYYFKNDRKSLIS